MMQDFEKLERLLLNKSYQELTPSEEHWLTTQGIGQESFQQQREVLRTMKQELSSKVQAGPSTAAFGDALAVQQRTTMRHRQGIWLVGAAMLVIGCLIGRWSGSAKATIIHEVHKEVPTREIIRDTLFLKHPPRKLSSPTVIYRERIQRDTIYIPMPIADKVSTEELARDMLSVTTVKDLPDLSRNARDTEALLKVLVQVY